MADTKSYNPKSVTTIDQYMVQDDGHDRFFIPVNNDEHGAGGTEGADSMAKQLALCKLLSPTGTAVDEHPDLPLEIVTSGFITGDLNLGGTAVGHSADAEHGTQPLSYSCQVQTSNSGTSGWSNFGSPHTPDEYGKFTWTNTVATSGKYYRVVTTVTDSADPANELVDTQAGSYGPVLAPDASLTQTPPSPATQATGTESYVWLGDGNYTLSMQSAYQDDQGAWIAMTEGQDYAATLNAMFTDLNLLVCSPSGSGNNLSIRVTSSELSTGSLQLKGQCTDTYTSISDTAQQGIVVNFPSAFIVTVDGGISGNKKIGHVLTGTAATSSTAGATTCKWLQADTENGTYTDLTAYETPVDGKITYTQLTTDAGKWFKLRTKIGNNAAEDSPAYGPTTPANANITEYSVSPISVPVGQTTSKEFPGTYNYTGTWSMSFTDDSGWQTQPWMPATNIADDYNAMFGTSFTSMTWVSNNGIIHIDLATGPGQAAGFTVQTQMKLTDSISDSAGTDSNSDTVPQNYLTS